jgi:hypothetical protein
VDNYTYQVSGNTVSSTNGHQTSGNKKDTKKGGIASMFANAAKKSEDKKAEDNKAESNGTTAASKQKPQKVLTS